MGKAKKGGKKGGSDGEVELSPMEVVENVALQRQLAERQEEASKAIAARKEIQERVKELKQGYEEHENTTYSLVNDMTRQYKSMQEELLNRINILENTINELNDKLEKANVTIEDMKKDREDIICAKDAEIAEQKQRQEDMSKEFADMLKETLEKMSERIDISGSFEDASSSAQQKLAEFKV